MRRERTWLPAALVAAGLMHCRGGSTPRPRRDAGGTTMQCDPLHGPTGGLCEFTSLDGVTHTFSGITCGILSGGDPLRPVVDCVEVRTARRVRLMVRYEWREGRYRGELDHLSALDQPYALPAAERQRPSAPCSRVCAGPHALVHTLPLPAARLSVETAAGWREGPPRDTTLRPLPPGACFPVVAQLLDPAGNRWFVLEGETFVRADEATCGVDGGPDADRPGA
ncbi:MAG: hypothetical protein JWM10_359 [Myxococcaceae bacterium]|nr:hypothetical protein [Myxococcaceae bacterium]